jgi:hypothetical protein
VVVAAVTLAAVRGLQLPLVFMLRLIRLYLALSAWALWMGGFSFYFGVVVPIGGQLSGGSQQGFVTQQVTYWLNGIGAGALGLLLWEAIGRRNRLLMGSWIVLAVLQVGLIVMHRQLDLLLDGPSRSIMNEAKFATWHEWYEFASAIQWFTGMVYLGGLTRSVVAERRHE